MTQSFNITADFASWQYAGFAASSDPAVIGPTVVRGQDGLPNLVKYALGLDPAANVTTGLPAVTSDGTNWNCTFTKPAAVTDVTVAVESSSDLATWSSSGVTLVLVGTSNGVETWRATVPLAGHPTLFFRLRVSQP